MLCVWVREREGQRPEWERVGKQYKEAMFAFLSFENTHKSLTIGLMRTLQQSLDPELGVIVVYRFPIDAYHAIYGEFVDSNDPEECLATVHKTAKARLKIMSKLPCCIVIGRLEFPEQPYVDLSACSCILVDLSWCINRV